MDYYATFSYMAHLNSIHVLLSIVVNQNWCICQLDVKNAFLYDELAEQVYMEQPTSYAAQGEVCLP